MNSDRSQEHRSMQHSSPLARLSLRVHQSRQRHGIAGIAQRMALVVLPTPPAVVPAEPAIPVPELATPEMSAARERARRALVEARRTMSGVIGEEVVIADLPSESMPPAITPDWDQLQAYLEETERERAALKEELADLRETVRVLQSRLDGFERALPAATVAAPEPSTEQPETIPDGVELQPETLATTEAPEPTEVSETTEGAASAPDAATVSPDEEDPTDDEGQVRELRERVLRALRERVFAAGTVGTKVLVSPAPDEPALRGMIERFNEHPLVDHAELIESKEEDAEAATIRVSLRAPMRWEQFGDLLERALAQPVAQADVRWSQGAVRVQLSSESPPASEESPHDATEPCV
jgi:hypothetical protein